VRLFVAVELPTAVRDDLDAALPSLRAVSPEHLRWVPPARWHLTLAFLGEVAEPAADELRERLARAARRHGPTQLTVRGGGRFDGRVLWAGLVGDVDALRRLAQSVAAGARRAGVPVEDRPYRPHLTLARARRPTDLRPLAAGLADYAGPAWQATEIALVHSHLGPEPRYDTLVTWPLGSGGGTEG
jgi:2'-5' RNA ligase